MSLLVVWHIPCRTAGEVSLNYRCLLCYGCGELLDMKEEGDEIAVQNVPDWWIESPDQYDYFPPLEQ